MKSYLLLQKPALQLLPFLSYPLSRLKQFLAFYFILKAFLVRKIFKLLSLFLVMYKNRLNRKIMLLSNLWRHNLENKQLP